MKAENLFRFVSIRSPLPAVEAPPVTPGLVVPNGNGFLTGVRGRVNNGEPVDQARRAQAAEVMASPVYVTRNPTWTPYLAIEVSVRRLLAEVSPSEDLRAALERLLEAPVGAPVQLDAFVRGDEFAQLKESLWSSFFGVVVLPSRRPQDLPRIGFWLRFLHLLERIASGEQHRELLEEFDRWRPAVPNLVFRAVPAATPEPEPERPNEWLTERRRQFAAATASLDEVRAAHTHIAALVGDRSRAPRQPPSGGADGGVVVGEDDVTLRPEEIDPAVLATLARLGLSPSRVDGVELVARLADRLASSHAEVSSLRRWDEVVTVGSALVRRRRTLTDAELEGDAP